MAIIWAFIAFNIIIVPILIFFHLQGECAFLSHYMGSFILSHCDAVNNIWLNILYANGLWVTLVFFSKTHKMTTVNKSAIKPSPQPPQKQRPRH